MAFELRPTERVGSEVRRVAVERLDDAIARIDGLQGAEPEQIEGAVHEVRKRCKETRGLARLVRPALGSDRFSTFDTLVRSAATELSAVRDAHATLATFDQLCEATGADAPQLELVRTAQVHLADEATAGLGADDPRLAVARKRLRKARRTASRWDLPDDVDVIAAGLEATYRRGQRRGRRAAKRPTARRFHEWRSAVKRLWYQVRLVQHAAPSVLGPLTDSLDRLGEALGDDHDLAVLVERLDADPERYGGRTSVDAVRALTATQQRELRARAVRLGATVFAESPAAFALRVRRYWALAVELGPERAAGGIAQLAAERDDEQGDGHRHLELERKYLVTESLDLPTGIPLRQGYLAIDGVASVRVRDAGPGGCTLTVKVGAGARRVELEWPIERSSFDAAWEHTTGRRVSKTRTQLPVGEHRADIDVFDDELDGLVVAEVEFSSEEAMAGFVPPEWFGPEVTDDVRYTNAALARDGLDPELFERWAPP